jgi:hypothetical protein
VTKLRNCPGIRLQGLKNTTKIGMNNKNIEVEIIALVMVVEAAAVLTV